MPKGNSIYDIYAGAGEAMGKYEASWGGVQDIYSDIEYSRAMTAQKQEQREGVTDTLLAAVELGSTLYGGHMAKKEFQEKTLPGMEKIAAKEAYQSTIGATEGAATFEDFIAKDAGASEFMDKFKGRKVGTGGKSWEEMGTLEKMWEKPSWAFGEGKTEYTLGKEDMGSIAEMSKYGVDVDLGQYQSLFTEATKQPEGLLPWQEEQSKVSKELTPAGVKKPKGIKPPPEKKSGYRGIIQQRESERAASDFRVSQKGIDLQSSLDKLFSDGQFYGYEKSWRD
jgi:hypothetical protein